MSTETPDDIQDALVVSEQPPSNGVLALALMDDGDFASRLKALKKGRERVRQIQRELLEEGIDKDYGKIPGTPKPTLLKPGAEKLCLFYGLVPSYVPTVNLGDGKTQPHFRVAILCRLHKGDTAGPVVAEGVGAANSWERKHRYRKGARVCPACNKAGILLTKKGQWWHPKDARPDGGCNANFKKDDPAVTEQKVGDVENPDPFDLENGLTKVAKKRAFIDATLTATATSDLFAQDVEDSGPDPEHYEPEPERKPERKKATAPEAPAAAVPSNGAADPALFRAALKDDDSPVIGLEQRKYLFARAKEFGFNEARLRQAVKDITDTDSTGKLTERQVGAVVLYMDALAEAERKGA